MQVKTSLRPKQIDWAKAKAFYLSSPDVSLATVSREFGVSRQSVSKWANIEKWMEQKEQVDDLVTTALSDKLASMLIDARLQQATLGSSFLQMAAEAMQEQDKYGKRKIKVKDVKDLKDIALAGATLQKTGLGFDQDKPQANVVVMVQTPQGTTLDITKVT